MTDRTMYDGVPADAGAIARLPNIDMVAGYDDGNFAWSSSEWNLFPHAYHVHIAVFASTNSGHVIDCENGDATPDQAAAWVRMRKAAGLERPTIYCNLSTAQAVRTATGNLLLGQDYDMWVADWTGSPHEIVFADGRKAAATQWASLSDHDVSTVYDSGWPHVKSSDPNPPPSQGPYRHTVPSGSTATLDDIALDRNWSLDKLVAFSLQNLDPPHAAVLNAYVALDTACQAAPGTQRPVAPTGLVYYTVNP